MPRPAPPAASPPPSAGLNPPPRAFTQGLGLVFQVVGVLMFLAMSFICCGSSLLSKDWATRTDLTQVGWHLPGDPFDLPSYSIQRATTVSVFAGVFFGVALAGVGLGLQAERRAAPLLALALTLLGTTFWLVHGVFAAAVGRSVLFTILACCFVLLFGVLFALAINSTREMRRNPPSDRHEVLLPGYKIPYSHYHEDPPEIRLAAELQQRRERLAVQQKELELLEEKLKKKLEEDRQREERE